METFFFNPKRNKQGLYDLLKSLDIDQLWRIRIDKFDERTVEQNKKMHAMLGDIAAQCKHLNQVLEIDDWKRLCVQQFRDDCISNDLPKLADYWNKHNFKLMPSLDGRSLVSLGTQTRDFPKYVAAGFMEWLYAYGAENNIQWTEPQYFDERHSDG